MIEYRITKTDRPYSTVTYEFGVDPRFDTEDVADQDMSNFFQFELEHNTHYQEFKITDMSNTIRSIFLDRVQAESLAVLLNDLLGLFNPERINEA